MKVFRNIKVVELMNYYRKELQAPLNYDNAPAIISDLRGHSLGELLKEKDPPYYYYLCAYDIYPHVLIVRTNSGKVLDKHKIILQGQNHLIV